MTMSYEIWQAFCRNIFQQITKKKQLTKYNRCETQTKQKKVIRRQRQVYLMDQCAQLVGKLNKSLFFFRTLSKYSNQKQQQSNIKRK